MSLAIELTQCQERIAQAGKTASATVRRLKTLLPVELYEELMLAHCAVAAGALELKVLLGSLRMMGELGQRPPAVTAETLELYCGDTALESRATPEKTVTMWPTHEIQDERARFARELAKIGDTTLESRATGEVES